MKLKWCNFSKSKNEWLDKRYSLPALPMISTYLSFVLIFTTLPREDFQWNWWRSKTQWESRKKFASVLLGFQDVKTERIINWNLSGQQSTFLSVAKLRKRLNQKIWEIKTETERIVRISLRQLDTDISPSNQSYLQLDLPVDCCGWHHPAKQQQAQCFLRDKDRNSKNR